jgi:hypothetical protein
VDLLFEQVGAELAKLKTTQRVVSVSDWRSCPPLSDEISRLLLERMGAAHPRVQAAAVIVSKDSPTDLIQFLRAVCSSKRAGRKLFLDAANDLMAWAHPFLTGAEFRRLRAFIEQGVSTQIAVRPGRASPCDSG